MQIGCFLSTAKNAPQKKQLVLCISQSVIMRHPISLQTFEIRNKIQIHKKLEKLSARKMYLRL